MEIAVCLKSQASCHNPNIKRLQWINQNLFQIDLVRLMCSSAWSSVSCQGALSCSESRDQVGELALFAGMLLPVLALRMLGKTREAWLPNWPLTVSFYFLYSPARCSACRSGCCPDGILPLARRKSIFPRCTGVGREGSISCLAQDVLDAGIRWWISDKRVFLLPAAPPAPPGPGRVLSRKVPNFSSKS